MASARGVSSQSFHEFLLIYRFRQLRFSHHWILQPHMYYQRLWYYSTFSLAHFCLGIPHLQNTVTYNYYNNTNRINKSTQSTYPSRAWASYQFEENLYYVSLSDGSYWIASVELHFLPCLNAEVLRYCLKYWSICHISPYKYHVRCF